MHAARATTAAEVRGTHPAGAIGSDLGADDTRGTPVRLLLGEAEPSPVNQLALRGRAVTRTGSALVLPAGVDVASVLGVRATDDPMSVARPGAALGASFAASVAIEACRALAPLHAGGQRHGRITPENVLLDDTGSAAVVSLYPLEWADPRVPWRFEWMWHLAPEQLPGPEDDPRTDVFALALVMATLVAGRHPASAGATELDVMVALRERRLVLPDLSPQLAAALRVALAAPEDRYPDAVAFGVALAAAATADAVPFGSAIIADVLARLAAP